MDTVFQPSASVPRDAQPVLDGYLTTTALGVLKAMSRQMPPSRPGHVNGLACAHLACH